jgi:hypothetical protein
MRNLDTQLVLKKSSILTLMIILGIALASSLLIKQQLITGTITNAALIMGAFYSGIRGGILIGLLPSSIALATGLLPPLMAPMIPFIVIANIMLVLTVCILKNNNYWLVVAVAGTVKFSFLFITSVLIFGLIFQHGIPAELVMMAWPQAVTAFGGGIVAYGFMKALSWI